MKQEASLVSKSSAAITLHTFIVFSHSLCFKIFGSFIILNVKKIMRIVTAVFNYSSVPYFREYKGHFFFPSATPTQETDSDHYSHL
jgi:hypothetical protein